MKQFFYVVVLQSQLRASEAVRQSVCGVKLDEICLPGNTLLWDLVQDHNIVSIFSFVNI